MTPAQLRAFAAVARNGSVQDAAAELDVTGAAVSAHVAALRRELGDDLFHRTGAGLAFTPGGLRLASRAVEMLGLQDRTRVEVAAAAQGRRVLQITTTSLFGEHAAPGLIELFSQRADDLEVELAVGRSDRLVEQLTARATDVVVAPGGVSVPDGVEARPFLRYEVLLVAAPDHPTVRSDRRGGELASADWLVGPSAAEPSGVTRQLLVANAVGEERQRIFQSHAAALDEARSGTGVALALGHAVTKELAAGTLVKVPGSRTSMEAVWTALALTRARRSRVASELLAFVATPRALRAMISGSGSDVRRFRPSVHVTLWR